MKEYRFEITLPEKVLNFLGLPRKDLEKGLKRELAIHFFQSEVLSFGQARELSGMSVWDFIELLKDRNTPLHYGLLEYEEDSETVERLMKIGKLSPILHPLLVYHLSESLIS